MPTYEYRCPDGHDFERFFRKISDAQIEVACPVCGKIAERRMSAGAGLLFKGSGFYLTDYGKNAHRGEAPASGGESKSESKGESSSSGSSESKSGESSSSKSESKSESKSTESKPAPAPAAPTSKPPKSD
jgi:putative FmdB family regulatory protein